MTDRHYPDTDETEGSSAPAGSDQDNRRSTADRRAEDRRRSSHGLLEKRARRDGVSPDRRQVDRRATSRFRLAFWRRSDPVQ